MKKLFNKSLAVIVATALCLTAFIGCLSVSADNPGAGTIIVDSTKSVKQGETVIVPVTITSTEGDGIAAARFDVDYDASKLTLTAITGEAKVFGTDTYSVIHPDYKNDENNNPVPTDGNIVVLIKGFTETTTNDIVNYSSAIVNLTFTAADEAVIGSTPVTVGGTILEACDSGIVGGVDTGLENTVTLTATDGTVNITAKECDTHTWGAWTSVDATNHSRTCSVCGDVETAAHTAGEWIVDQAATTTEAGSKHKACVDCGYVMETEAIPATGAVLDSTIAISSVSAAISDSLGTTFIINPTAIPYASCEVVIIPTKYDGSYNEVTGTEVVGLKQEVIPTLHMYTYYGVAMYELGLDISAYIKCYDAEGNYVAYSNTMTTTMADALKSLYNNANAGTTLGLKTKAIVTDLLNLGAAAQQYFSDGKTSSDLYKATLVNDGFDQTYASTTLGTLNTINNQQFIEGAALNASNCTILQSVGLAGSPSVAYTIMTKNGTTLDVSKLSLTVSYETLFPATSTISETVSGSDWQGNGSTFFLYSFSKTKLYDANKTVTATLSYDGNVVWTSNYSVESFVNAQQSTSKNGPISVCIGKFAASAREYFSATAKGAIV